MSSIIPEPLKPSPTKQNDLNPVLSSEACPPAGPYSQAIRVGNQIWVAGQIPADSQGQLIEGSIADQTRQCCRNIEAILKAAGSNLGRVVRCGIGTYDTVCGKEDKPSNGVAAQVFLDDMSNFAEMNSEYEKWFVHKPARTCVAVKQLPKGVPVEIEAVAVPE